MSIFFSDPDSYSNQSAPLETIPAGYSFDHQSVSGMTKIPASSIPKDAIKDIILDLLKDPEFVDQLQWALALADKPKDEQLRRV